ncbi:hypothetical protein GCM10010520_59530 [Rhizobium viscosum]|uniref:Outer membrane biosynthesis protein TonB n=1 Tax=Rhizobium viscosum TaxID=1673 RepID=A0ABR9ITH4_RHIVS|nr:hypothetical protein [Rhizobium viscosum]MBE1506507.1 outer membrane biosynthesis protein TonB [Rhizobium viscosum]
MKAALSHAARTLVLLLALATTAGFAATAKAQNASLAGERQAVLEMRNSIKQHWRLNPELGALDGIRGTVRFAVNAEGRLVGKPQVSVTGGTAAKRAWVKSSVKEVIQKASPFPRRPKGAYPSVMEFMLPFQFDQPPRRAPLERK